MGFNEVAVTSFFCPLIRNIRPPIGKCFGLFLIAGKVCAVRVSKGQEIRALVLVIAITMVPVAGTVIAVVATTQPNLSGLTPIRNPQPNYSLVDWSNLGHPNKAVQVLGYMFDGDRPLREGDWVQDFVLLPEAGNVLHPAHRDHMISVHLKDNSRIQFSPKSLVWVWGTFRESPLSVEQAAARPADKNEIRKYFK
jgi:hypothetical protein